MKHCLFPGTFFLFIAFAGPLVAQPWTFAKEEDGIRVYTRQEPGKTLKSYRGVADIQAPADKVFSLIEDVKHTEWWDDDIIEIRVLDYEKDKRARYYLVFDSPWPVSNRDLYVDVTASADRAKGIYSVISVPLAEKMPDRDGLVRIRDYRQSWTIKSTGVNSSHVVLEGYGDPGGNIPVWVANKIVTQSPVKSIQGIVNRISRNQAPHQ